jgi:hypothetical protein
MTRRPIKKQWVIDPDVIAGALAQTPEQLNNAQRTLDAIRYSYEARMVELSIAAMGAAIFPGKTPEDPKRAASNERERDLAIQSVCLADAGFQQLRLAYEEAQREVSLTRDRQTNYRLIAQLFLK